jgi:hypothetical protein
MPREHDFFGGIAPRHFDEDTRTLLIAQFAATSANRGLADEIGALLVETVVGLREAKVLNDEAALIVIRRWTEALANWKRGDGSRATDVLMSIPIKEELPWGFPDLVPDNGGRPPRFGRKRRPKRPPVA